MWEDRNLSTNMYKYNSDGLTFSMLNYIQQIFHFILKAGEIKVL